MRGSSRIFTNLVLTKAIWIAIFQVGIVTDFLLRTKPYRSWVYVVTYLNIVHMIHVRQKQDSLTVTPSTIREAAEATAKREIESQKAQFRHFGIMADWSPEFTYRTLGVCRN